MCTQSPSIPSQQRTAGKSQNEGVIVEQRKTPSATNDLLLASVQAHEITLVIITAAADQTALAVQGISQLLE